MTEPGGPNGPGVDADLEAIAGRLRDLHALLRKISDEVGPGTLRGSEAVVERYRPMVYGAMEALFLAARQFVQSGALPERIEAARNLIIGRLREISLTSPIAFFGAQGKARRLSYFELVQHVRDGRATGADLTARILDDFYVHTRIGEAFLNRLNLLTRRLTDEVARHQSLDVQPVQLLGLHYIGGDELLPLAHARSGGASLQVTCLDDGVLAVRDAEQRLRPAFGSRVRCIKADPLKWLGGPETPSGSVSIVYDASFLEQQAPRRVVQILQGVHRVLRPRGVLLMGSTAGNPPVAEVMMRDWLLGWDWEYRTESEWRALFAQTPFGADHLGFEYEPLGINALVRVEKRI